MKPTAHIVASGLISGALYYYFKSAPLAAMNLVGGVLIDADHLIDYFIEQKPTLKLRKILRHFYNKKFKRAYVFLHSLEMLFLLWIYALISGSQELLVGLAIGISQHMLFDQLANKMRHPFAYSFIYRTLNDYRKESFLKE